MVSQGSRQQQPRIGHRAVVVEGHIESIGLCDDRINQVLLCWAGWVPLTAIFAVQMGT